MTENTNSTPEPSPPHKVRTVLLGHMRQLLDAAGPTIPLVTTGPIGYGIPVKYPDNQGGKVALALTREDGALVGIDAQGKSFPLAAATNESLFTLLGSLVVSAELELERKNKNRPGR